MPTYEYVCHKCDTHLEVYQSFDEAPLKRHRGGCGGKLTKVLAPVGVVLKGSGFYKTDSSDSSRSKAKSKAKSKAEAGAGSDATTSGDAASSSSAAKSDKPKNSGAKDGAAA